MSNMPASIENTILGKIMTQKHVELQRAYQQFSQADLNELAKQASTVRSFLTALQAKVSQNLPAVIAEIKKASPSKGIIRQDFNPAELAVSYEQGGASCLSILTDEQFFKGHADYLTQGRDACQLPVLRKDFMANHYHITQSRAMNADCVLLIVACLSDTELAEMYAHANELGMDALIEVHDEQEMERALRLPAKLIGINNRNLKTFEVDLNTTTRLKQLVDSERLLVTESGIMTKQDVQLMRDQAIHTFLVGESFMRQPDVGKALQSLFF